jgi:3-oxosteroid 1-dehydrogenase
VTESAREWDHVVDLAVVGSGAGGLTAGLIAHDAGLRTLVLEKSDFYGGSSAMSGGVLWVPNNPLMRTAGLHDSADDALAYLCEESGGRVGLERLRKFVNASPKMVEYLLRHSRLRLNLHADYPDYHPNARGGRVGGRSIEPRPLDGAVLGPELAQLRPPHPSEVALGRVALSLTEARLVAGGSLRGKALLARWLVAELADARAWRLRRPRRLTLGNALVGRLRWSLLDRDVPLWRRTVVRRLVTADHAIVGIDAELNGRAIRIGARHGVLLASGGFDHSAGMRRRFQHPGVCSGWSAGNPENVGDGLRLGLEVGGQLELMDQAWWTPTLRVPDEPVGWPVIFEKALPGSILVDRNGCRFTNEAASYSDVVLGMFASGASSAFLIFDARFRREYPCGPILPGWIQPDWSLPERYTRRLLRRATTLAGLASQLGILPETLCQSVESFNRNARIGRDPDFKRGDSVYDRYWGDSRCKPNPCLARLEKPPFYAVEVHPGDLGTKGGLVTDAHARVLDASGDAIDGLYATGNCTASVMGNGYPGAGATLAPAMTFGYIAALTAAGAHV